MLELVTVLGIVAVLATMSFATMRYARRNASVASTAFELTLWLEGHRARAMRDQEDLMAVIFDAANPTFCARGDGNSCGRYVLLRPDTGFTLGALNADTRRYPRTIDPPERPGVIQDEQLPEGLRFFSTTSSVAAPAPYDKLLANDPDLVVLCTLRRCVGIRFRPDGTVEAQGAMGPLPAKTGLALVLGSDLSSVKGGAGDLRTIVVTFPTGIVRNFGLFR